MEMPGRQYNATYTYSFNGKRDDKDAEYGWQDYGMREYDRRSSRFISLDPLTKKYPWYSPFQYAGNKPVWKQDIDGMEEDDLDAELNEREELLKREDRVENSKLLSFPTAQERERQQKEVEQFSKRTPEEQSARFRNLINILNNYGKNSFESAEIVFGASPKQSTFNFENASRIIEAKTVGITPRQALMQIQTLYGIAKQSLTIEASIVVNKVYEGATMYKVGTLGNSNAAESQFWTLENPTKYLNNPKEFAAKYGIPVENLKAGKTFIQTGKLSFNSNFITRPAPGVGDNKGGAVEIVTNPGSVKIETFTIIN